MKTVNIHEAKTHLSRLVERAANGETLIIAKAGKPMVKRTPLGPPDDQPQRDWAS
jgi:prevent-host-death family protein